MACSNIYYLIHPGRGNAELRHHVCRGSVEGNHVLVVALGRRGDVERDGGSVHPDLLPAVVLQQLGDKRDLSLRKPHHK